jgi:hypothetical protein
MTVKVDQYPFTKPASLCQDAIAQCSGTVQAVNGAFTNLFINE